MVTITFQDRETERKALGFLLGRFSGRVLKNGEHIVPEAAIEALAARKIPFCVKGTLSDHQRVHGESGVCRRSPVRQAGCDADGDVE